MARFGGSPLFSFRTFTPKLDGMAPRHNPTTATPSEGDAPLEHTLSPSAAAKLAPTSPDDMLVRIKPSNMRATHSVRGFIIKKTDGWVAVPRGVAMVLAEERMNDLNPEASAFVFDVMEQSQARIVEEAESEKIEPAGTALRPKKAAQLGVALPEAPRARR